MIKISSERDLSDKRILPVIATPQPCCSPAATPPRVDQDVVSGTIEGAIGPIPRVWSDWTRRDKLGAIKARWGVARMEYLVDPGLYALGHPDADAPVLVSANYKLSFDVLRKSLAGINAWILVLDTQGINVWCAAGKGTFGTDELVSRIQTSNLSQIVNHRRIIVPQLGAPGVAAHTVKKQTGFSVHYGPVRAADLPAYLEAGLKATPRMRQVTFSLRDRIVLIPMELTYGFKPFALLALAFFALATGAGFLAGSPGGFGGFWQAILTDGMFAAAALTAAFIAGAVLHPIVLPCLPARAFSVQGLMVGLLVAGVVVFFRASDLTSWRGLFEAAAWMLIIPAIVAFLAMNFTGSSTYTSLSGVKKEMRLALPAEIVAFSLGSVLWLVSLGVAVGGA